MLRLIFGSRSRRGLAFCSLLCSVAGCSDSGETVEYFSGPPPTGSSSAGTDGATSTGAQGGSTVTAGNAATGPAAAGTAISTGGSATGTAGGSGATQSSAGEQSSEAGGANAAGESSGGDTSSAGSDTEPAGGTPEEPASGGTTSAAGDTAAGGTENAGGASEDTAGAGGAPDEPVDECQPEDELCDGLDNNCDDDIDEGDACPMNCEGFAIGDDGYMFCPAERGFEQAQNICENNGMRLLRIESDDENDEITDTLRDILGIDDSGRTPNSSQEGIWLYARDEEEGVWEWLGDDGYVFWEGNGDGDSVDDAYTNWAEDQPNNTGGNQDCLRLVLDESGDGDPGEWTDIGCGLEYRTVCEVP